MVLFFDCDFILFGLEKLCGFEFNSWQKGCDFAPQHSQLAHEALGEVLLCVLE